MHEAIGTLKNLLKLAKKAQIVADKYKLKINPSQDNFKPR